MAGLLAGAILLLLVVNVATLTMIRRTATFNDTIAREYETRRTTRSAFISMLDAETGQRGFLLTGRPEFLRPFTEAVAALPEQIATLQADTQGDPDLGPRVENLAALSQRKIDEIQRTVDLANTGRFEDAAAVVRGGTGRAIMDSTRTEVAAIEEVIGTRLQFATRQSEWAANMTAVVNAVAGLLILAMAGISGWLIRRYLLETQAARAALDRLNEGLEQQVRGRTFELTRANEEVRRFAYIVSHDLRAPLVNVMGYTSELEQAGKVIDRQMTAVETKAPRLVEQDALTAVREDVPEAIGFIRASTEKMDRLINAILKLSREGRRSLLPERLDMTAMAQGVADSVHHQTDASDAEIVIEPLPSIESDRLSMEQILGNLIDNAVKYLALDRAGRIVVSGRETGDGWVLYRIEDNGRGISDRDHERIFELFRRSGKQDRAGEGLGLAFVRNSVRRLGGDITVESELGKGSTFTLKFPTRLVLADAGDY